MRNETTRSAILSPPTPLALVCVLFSILMHIQWIDLHYTCVAQCLFHLLLRLDGREALVQPATAMAFIT